MNLEVEVRKLLGSKVNPPRTSNFDKLYHQGFEKSGIRKALEVLGDLEKRSDLDLSKCAYFSIGGSTGSEIFHVLSNSLIRHGVLLEFDPVATGIAQGRQSTLHSLRKELVIVTGDVMQQLRRCIDQFLDWQDSGQINGLVVSAQAVLHELPSRSPGFDLSHFMGEVCWEWDPFLFYSREPSPPADWPDRVEIHVPGMSSPLLEALAKDIQATLGITGLVLRSGPSWVALPADLAIETLTKIFYLDDYWYEMEEQVTSIDPMILRAVIENHLGENTTALTRLTSESFKQNYRELGIQARTPLVGEKLYMPETFAWIIAERISPPSRRVRGSRTGV